MHRLSEFITAAIFIVLVFGAGLGFITAAERVATWQGPAGDTNHNVEKQRTAVNTKSDNAKRGEDGSALPDGSIRVAIAN